MYLPIPYHLVTLSTCMQCEMMRGDKEGTVHLRPAEKGHVAANLTKEEIEKPFTVGDNATYGGHHNKPLLPGTRYYMSYTAVDAAEVS